MTEVVEPRDDQEQAEQEERSLSALQPPQSAVAPWAEQDPARGREAGTSADEDRTDAETAELLPSERTVAFRQRWEEIQARFVDEPKSSVKEADDLVSTVIGQLADGFARERASLEQRWDQSDDVTTEDLRMVLRRYRSFFERLLAA